MGGMDWTLVAVLFWVVALLLSLAAIEGGGCTADVLGSAAIAYSAFCMAHACLAGGTSTLHLLGSRLVGWCLALWRWGFSTT